MTVAIKAAAVVGMLLTPTGAGAAAPSRALGIAALITWLLDAASGAYMLGTWIVRGGLRRQRSTGDRLAPAVVFAHFGMASTGLLIWITYLATRWAALAWLAIGLLMLVIGLGISTVTLWTPFPAHRTTTEAEPGPGGAAAGPRAGAADDALTLAVTDEDLARALTDEVLLARLIDDVLTHAPGGPPRDARKPRGLLTSLIPAGHGMAAIATILLAVLAAAVGAAR